MKKSDWQERKSADESTRRDKTRDKRGVKASRRDARKRKSKRREFERADWT